MEPLRIDDITNLKFISSVEFSPSGKHACFVVHQADVDENGYSSNLFLYDVDSEEYFQLTAFDKEKGYTWLEDGEHILFPGVRKAKDQKAKEEGEQFTVFYKINIHGGEAQEAFRIPLPVKAIEQIDDKRFIFTATYNPNWPWLVSYSPEEQKEEIKRRKEEQDYQVLEEIPFWSNGEGFVSLDRTRLFIYDLETDSWEALTDEETDIDSYNLNQDKTKAVIVGQVYQGKRERENSLYIADLTAKSVRKLTPQEKFAYMDANFINDNTLISRGSTMATYGLNENSQFYLVDLESGEKQLLTPDFENSTWNSVGSDCRYGGSKQVKLRGEFLYFPTTEGSNSLLNRIDVNGKIERVVSGTGSVDSYDVHQDRVIMVGLRDMRLQELYQVKDGKEKQITHFNDWVKSERKTGVLQPLSISTAPGVMIDGWILKPVDFEEGKTYPAILDIHGGPKTVYGEVFYHEMQYWANQGYFVFFCNPRGSDGKGNAFADIRGKYGTIDYEDIMKFTDAVLEKYPSIDKERLGVTGGSYGGFMTNWIIGHTNRFKAAATQRSIANWVSMGFTADIGYFFVEDQIGATPWDDVDKLWEHSPLKYADQIKTPTLVIHSENDYRCWLPEGLQMFTALKYHGVEARLCMFRDENHELSRSGKPKHRVRRLKEITEWFDRHLK